MANQSLVMTTEQLAKELHIGRNKVAELRKSGEIPGIRLGKSWIYTIDDVKAFLNRSKGKDLSNG